MTVFQKFFISFGFLFLLIQLLFILPEQIEIKDLSPVAVVSSDKVPEQVMTGVHLFESRANKEDWELTAVTAEAFAATVSWKLKDVKIIFYGEEINYDVKSNEAEINTSNMDIKIFGNIDVKTSNDYEFQTEFLNYFSSTRALDSPTRTKFVSPPDSRGSRMLLESDKLIANLDDNQVQAIGNVYAQKQERKSDVKVRSKQAVMHLDTQSSQFMDDVKIDYHTSVMQGPLASLKYDGVKNILTELVMTGGSTLKDQNRLAYAQTMSINFLKDLFHLTGNPRVIQDGDELIGKDILLLNGGKQIQVRGAKAQIEDLMGK
jgi:LPS export ABC transporter protein LptC